MQCANIQRLARDESAPYMIIPYINQDQPPSLAILDRHSPELSLPLTYRKPLVRLG